MTRPRSLPLFVEVTRPHAPQPGAGAAAPPEVARVHVQNEEEVFYTCDCKGCCHTGGLCSHILVARHLDGDLDIDSLVQNLDAPRARGRPHKAVGALHRQSSLDERAPHPSSFIGAKVMRFFREWHESQPFIGQVKSIRRPEEGFPGTSANTLFRVQYPPQLSAETETEEELLYEELVDGIWLYM